MSFAALRLCFSITILITLVTLKHNLRESRADDALPPLTPEELATPQQQALLQALAGDSYGHRAADFARQSGDHAGPPLFGDETVSWLAPALMRRLR